MTVHFDRLWEGRLPSSIKVAKLTKEERKDLSTNGVILPPRDKDAETLLALKEVEGRIAFVRGAIESGNMTTETAASKLRSLSIELGVVASMPFR